MANPFGQKRSTRDEARLKALMEQFEIFDPLWPDLTRQAVINAIASLEAMFGPPPVEKGAAE